MMNIVFLTNLYPKEIEGEIRAKMSVDMNDAANALQWNLINGIEHQLRGEMSLVNRLPIYSWPKHYTDVFICTTHFSHVEGADDISPGFCNVSGIKQFSGKKLFYNKVKEQCIKHKSNIILLYSLQPLFLESVQRLKKTNPSIKAYAIVADLPEFSSSPKGIVGKLFHVRNGIHIQELLHIIDGYILLTDQMASKLKITVPYMVMEGTIDKWAKQYETKTIPDKKIIFYSGSLNRQYGILILLEAFEKLVGNEYRLVLCGLGNAEQEVLDYCSKDSRVSFLGKKPHSEVLKLQQNATVLVNPRQNNEEFTKYSFPSKIMEYLASGVPVVAYKLDGMPSEYDKYIEYVPDNTSETLANVLKRICDLSPEERKQIGEKGREFVITQKNNIKQTKKILDFIRNTSNVSD